MTATIPGRGAGAAAKRLLAWLLVLALLTAVGYLLSERNSRTWALVPDEGRLVVKRGVLFPVGTREFQPSDPALAKVYAPLVPPPGTSLPAAREFLDESDVDRALYDLLWAWAREDVTSGDPARLERGLGYLERAMDLPAISAAQRDGLAGLQAESGYFEARRLLERARAELTEAARKLRVTAGSRSTRAGEAEALLRELGPALEATAAALHAAGPIAQPPPAVEKPPPEGRPAEATRAP
jgi:hypothetical protein